MDSLFACSSLQAFFARQEVSCAVYSIVMQYKRGWSNDLFAYLVDNCIKCLLHVTLKAICIDLEVVVLISAELILNSNWSKFFKCKSYLDKVIILLAKVIWPDNDSKWFVTGLVNELTHLFTAGLLATIVFQVLDIPLLISDTNQDASRLSWV